ncbi:MAG: serine--tRNA ligase [Defluviitaleaceae bacterium]|nr:serine--tRNA ligase [Defluviitaleaceae bacterium]
MLDAKYLRENFDTAQAAIARRGKGFDLSPFLDMDKKRRALILEVEELKAKQNADSKQVPILKKEGKDTTAIFAEMKLLSEKIAKLDGELNTTQKELDDFLLIFANFPNPSVPDGADDTSNIEMRKHLEPTKFAFEPLPHWELGKSLNILDNETAGITTGSRFMFLKGAGARLERALINFMLDLHVENHGYTEIFPPFIAHERSMYGTGQLPKFAEDAFKLEGWDYYLIPTSEVTVTNMHRESIIDGVDLPIKYTAFSACFRAEAGSAGRDTRGLVRQHQFNKVELVKFTRPEDSYAELEKLTENAEEVLKQLQIPYRVVKLCAGDLGFSAAMTYDIEVWMPSYNRYVEISSCSNFEDFQARRAQIRYKDGAGTKPALVHTLNGSGIAIGRTMAAIIENFQNADGSITIPQALQPYMRGVDKIVSN